MRETPMGGGTSALTNQFVPSLSVTLNENSSFLSPTSSSNPNIVRYKALDAFGLITMGQQKLDVIAAPQFYTAITWNPATHGFNLEFKRNVIDYHKTISDILGLDVPIIGTKDNQFTIGLSALGFATLNPNTPVPMPVTSSILIKAPCSVCPCSPRQLWSLPARHCCWRWRSSQSGSGARVRAPPSFTARASSLH